MDNPRPGSADIGARAGDRSLAPCQGALPDAVDEDGMPIAVEPVTAPGMGADPEEALADLPRGDWTKVAFGEQPGFRDSLLFKVLLAAVALMLLAPIGYAVLSMAGAGGTTPAP